MVSERDVGNAIRKDVELRLVSAQAQWHFHCIGAAQENGWALLKFTIRKLVLSWVVSYSIC